jgi:phenylalanyl-tRNA synthetase beta chain
MIELAGATVRPGTVDIGGEGPPPRTIRLRDSRVNGLLGTDIPRRRSKQILEALEFGATDATDGLDVTVPAFRRGDVSREADLIEEVARLDGLEKLPATLPSRHGASGRLTADQRRRRKASDALAAQGLHEVVGWSFVSPELQARLRLPNSGAVELENPMSGDQSQLRTMLLGSLLDVAQHNHARGATTLRLFDAGAVYLAEPSNGSRRPREPYHLAGLLTGDAEPPTWRDPDSQGADFYAVKGVVAGLLDALGTSWGVERSDQPFLHPGRAADVIVDGRTVGWLGELHPSVASEWELPATVAVFELDLDAIPHAPTQTYEDLISFPDVREDLAVVVSDSVDAAAVLRVVSESGAPLLDSVDVFDVYRDAEKLGPGRVSLALRLSYRAPDRTLTDAEVANQRASIVSALAENLGGQIRAS